MPFYVIRDDITKVKADAIVNTANPEPIIGEGVDKAIYEAAGLELLLKKRAKIGRVSKGEVFITKGYNLPAKYIIHAVGTPWIDGKHGEELIIRNCYKNIFAAAQSQRIKSLAIPLLASGSYEMPKQKSFEIAVNEINSFMMNSDMTVYLVIFDRESFNISSELYGDIDAYITENYVEEKTALEYDTFFTSSAPRFSRFDDSIEIDECSFEAVEEYGVSAEEKIELPKAFHDLHSMPFASDKKRTKSLEDVVKNLDKTFMELVFTFADEKNITDVQLQRKANIDRKAFSKLKCGTTKNPSKATALAIAVALELNLDETIDLLARAGLALSPCSKQDVIVQYFIEKEVYDIYAINVALFEHGESSLGSFSA